MSWKNLNHDNNQELPPKDDPSFPPNKNSTASLIGIGVAITGNVLISLALNCQKLAHRRLERVREIEGQGNQEQNPNAERSENDDQLTGSEDGPHIRSPCIISTSSSIPNDASNSSESDLLHTNNKTYGTINNTPHRPQWRNFLTRFFLLRTRSRYMSGKDSVQRAVVIPVKIIENAPNKKCIATENGRNDNSIDEVGYLKSKLWWLGFLLMNIGKMGNFISYGFAPASVVAPLGTV
jgi:magnesium transporter